MVIQQIYQYCNFISGHFRQAKCWTELVNKQQFQFYQWRKLSRKYDVLFKPLRLYRLLNLNITPYEETKLSPNLEENPNLIRPGDWSV